MSQPWGWKYRHDHGLRGIIARWHIRRRTRTIAANLRALRDDLPAQRDRARCPECGIGKDPVRQGLPRWGDELEWVNDPERCPRCGTYLR